MNKAELIGFWMSFTEKNDFMLNPNSNHVERIAEGCLKNEIECGLKLCPCRLRDGSRERDLELLCPCNFKVHEAWLKSEIRGRSECWCGLFVKK
ncbi:MAG: ferredoxin-thioredoxin reductase catalytic domain-containing protein [Candidatus Woesearchaeota archaeon]